MKIGFVGAGKVGKALGLYFKNHGLNITGYYSRSIASAREAAALTGSLEFLTLEAAANSSKILFISAPDQALEDIDSRISALMGAREMSTDKIWIHVSGAHPSDCLAGIKAAGCAVGSMHPLQSFGEPAASAAGLEKAWFTIEGTEKAALTVKTILDRTGGKYSLISAENKPLYHAGACVISNFLVTLLESGIRFFEAAGMERATVFQAIEPLVEATLANVRGKDTIDALTGPIVRADYNTVHLHLEAIDAQLSSELDFYKAMALKTVQMLEDKRLTLEQIEIFRQILGDTKHVR